MTRRARRTIFYTLLFSFFIVGTGVVLYVSGWRFDLATFRFEKVGAMYVRSYPAGANIYLGGQTVENKSGFFENGTLISNLFPGNYKLKLTLDNYEAWEESVSVSPSLVSEIKYAVLIPTNSQIAATGTIKDFQLLGDKTLIKDQKNNLLYDGKKIAAANAEGWTSDFKNILVYNTALGHYLLYNVDSATSTDINRMLKKSGLDTKQNFRIFVDSEDKRTLIVWQRNKLYTLNLGGSALTNIYKTNLELGTEISSSQFYYTWTEWNATENTSTLIVYDKFLQRTKSKLLELRGKNIELKWLSGANKIALLQDDGGLYVYDVSGGNMQKIADDVKSFSFTDNGGAAAALEHQSLEIFFFNREDNNYYRFNLSNISQAENVIWYTDENHLFVVYPAETKFLDIQNASLDYFPTVAKGRLPQYDVNNNRFYFVTDGSLKTLDFPK